MSAGAEQLTLDGGSVPHDDVVRGPSTSRMVRRPPSGEMDPASEHADEFLVRLARALTAAGVAPGEAFYVSRVPPVDRPREGGARRSDPSTSKRAAAMVTPRSGSQRWALLGAFEWGSGSPRVVRPYGLTAEQACERIGKPRAWRRVSELLAGGFIEPTGRERKTKAGADAEVYRITDKGRDTLAAGRTNA